MHASQLRQKLTLNDPEFKDGVLQLPTEPGLGVEINWDTVREYEFSKVVRENPQVAEMFAKLQCPMGPDHDIWDGDVAYGETKSAVAGSRTQPVAAHGSPWTAKPAVTLFGAGLAVGALGMRLFRGAL